MRSEEEPNPGLGRVRFELRADGVAADPPNALRSGIHSRGYLPHVKREGAAYFITFRLADSLPQSVLLQFQQQRAQALREMAAKDSMSREEIERDYRRKLERYLDKGAGDCHLSRPKLPQS